MDSCLSQISFIKFSCTQCAAVFTSCISRCHLTSPRLASSTSYRRSLRLRRREGTPILKGNFLGSYFQRHATRLQVGIRSMTSLQSDAIGFVYWAVFLRFDSPCPGVCQACAYTLHRVRITCLYSDDRVN